MINFEHYDVHWRIASDSSCSITVENWEINFVKKNGGIEHTKVRCACGFDTLHKSVLHEAERVAEHVMSNEKLRKEMVAKLMDADEFFASIQSAMLNHEVDIRDQTS